MRKRLHREAIKKKKGFLYFVDKDGDISCVAMARAGKKVSKRKMKVMRIGIKKQPGMLYFVDKAGYPAMAPMAQKFKKMRK